MRSRGWLGCRQGSNESCVQRASRKGRIEFLLQQYAVCWHFAFSLLGHHWDFWSLEWKDDELWWFVYSNHRQPIWCCICIIDTVLYLYYWYGVACVLLKASQMERVCVWTRECKCRLVSSVWGQEGGKPSFPLTYESLWRESLNVRTLGPTALRGVERRSDWKLGWSRGLQSGCPGSLLPWGTVCRASWSSMLTETL